MKKLFNLKIVSVILFISIILISICGCNNDAGDELSSVQDVTSSDSTATDDSVSVSASDDTNSSNSNLLSEDIIILYTNDVHCYINNMGKDKEDNEFPLLNYASVAAMKKVLEAEGENVLLVDAGDFSQGAVYGSFDEAKSIAQIMNATGYDLGILGNHEFDYGQFRSLGIIDELSFPLISCNFVNLPDNSTVLDKAKIFEFGDTKIAFVGVSTPEMISSSAPVYFQNEKGEYIYGITGSDNPDEFYNCVQQTIDEVRNEVDYVIGIGHLGIDLSSEPFTSTSLIANTTGFDAFIDGHSHSVVDNKSVSDKEGNNVVLTQTGCFFENIGKMSIVNGTIKTELISEYDSYDDEVQSLEDKLVLDVNDMLGKKIAVLDVPLYINEPDDADVRLVRNSETNLGDFTADSIYYYLNDVEGLDCDIAIANGGGIRTSLETGDYTYFSSKAVNPFGNVICLIETKGIDILNALETGARVVGLSDPDTGKSAEEGGFLQVSGLKYSIDTSIESSITLDDKDLFVSGPTGEYRVKDVCVYNKQTQNYEPLDIDKTYRLGGINYLLRNDGNGYTMFSDDPVIVDYIMEDYMMLSEYALGFTKEDDGFSHICTENCPLNKYKDFQVNYENPYGSERISIIIE